MSVSASFLANSVLMVRPAQFYSNPETQASNSFQLESLWRGSELLARAQAEFDAAAARLMQAGVEVLVLDADPALDTPDALFPNNWFTTHQDGRVLLYPMASENRRRERRFTALQAIFRGAGFQVTECVDLSSRELAGEYLEGTGSLIFDWMLERVYAARSPRTHVSVLADVAQTLALAPIAFTALDPKGLEIYHTNVLLALAPTLALVGADMIVEEDRARVLTSLAEQRDVLTLSNRQIECFAGNVLFLSVRGTPVVVLSSTAMSSLKVDQQALLARHANPIVCEVPTIERVGGGGIRCMLAEVFLPKEV